LTLAVVAMACFAMTTSAQAAELLAISHDGTSGDEGNPFDTLILSNDSNWTYTNDDARSVMTALDNNAVYGSNNRLILVSKDGVTEFTATGAAADKGWVFEIEIEILQGNDSSIANPFAAFGVRSENGAGKQAWLGLSNNGGTGGLGQIGFLDSSAKFQGATSDLNVDGLIGDGQYHNFKMHKYDNGGITTIGVFMDDSLVHTQAYSTIDDDVNTVDIQAFASATPVLLSEVNIDFVNFTLYDTLTESDPIPEPATMTLLAIGGFSVLLKRRRGRA